MTEQLPVADIEEAPPAPQDKLQLITTLAREQLKLSIEISKIEDQLKQKQEALARNMEIDLPNALTDAGIQGLPLRDGWKVELKTAVQASITEANQEEAHKWLEDNQQGPLIKRKIEILFGRDQVKWATKFLADCAKRKQQLNLKTKEWVDTNTLRAFVRKRRIEFADQGLNPDDAVPMKTFSVFIQKYATVEAPKTKATI